MSQSPSRLVLPDAPADQAELLSAGGVACWSEAVTIDTYEPGRADPYPLFLDRRVYQGSSGRVYPLPMIDSISQEKHPHQWQAIHLENAFVRLMLLPEIGGRIHVGYDKIAGYDFFYRNNVIKPALVGLAGPWISGGVEFNWPQHHRPATFLPVDTHIDREHDGSVIVWHSDLDPLQRMRGTHGVRLRPGCSTIDVEVYLHNRTDVAQTFLWWANVAARAHEGYQSFFPDDVGFVADHARRAVTAFPAADRPYYGVDYPALAESRPGADRIDLYSNIPVPTSYMVTDTKESFFGGYDHRANAGFVHWADRAISPGKKLWTWGDGPVGHAWDAQLTDTDGPYVELMAGVYTDNQPDFSWLVPGETKHFTQSWFPIHRIGPVRQASRDAALAVTTTPDSLSVGAITTRPHSDAQLVLRFGDDELVVWRGAIGPDNPVTTTTAAATTPSCVELRVDDSVLLTWIPYDSAAVEPWVATAPPNPDEIGSNDELILTAQHLGQYRHPTRSPLPYLREALERDPSDSRASAMLGAWHLSRGEYEQSVVALSRALARTTRRNLNPRDGETQYLLGLALERTGDLSSADTHLAKAAWNAAWTAPATLARARLALRRGHPHEAIELADQASDIPEARRVRILALRRAGEMVAADIELAELRLRHPLDRAIDALSGPVRAEDPRTALDVGAELARAGAPADALRATEVAAPAHTRESAFGNPEPLRHYLRAQWLDHLGRSDEAAAERRAARTAETALCFPAGLDHYDALVAALAAQPSDSVAAALLGMWMLDAGRGEDALALLEQATAHDSTDAVAWRNYALALVNERGDTARADEALAWALTLRRDARLVFERDVLAQLRGRTPQQRLAIMDEFDDLLLSRDDLAVAYIGLLLDVGRSGDALQIVGSRSFRPFEGGEGRAIAAYDRATIRQAQHLTLTDPRSAILLLLAGIVAPTHLGEGRHPADPQAERYVALGDAYAAVGDREAAESAWRTACLRTPLASVSRTIGEADFWIGVAHQRLGQPQEAEVVWHSLDARATDLEEAKAPVDFFATSVPELLLFDTDTAPARGELARQLRELATRGREAE